MKEEEETVPKSKVVEMEALFMDAINRLSDRVIQLEESKSRATPPVGAVGSGAASSENDWLNDDSEFGQTHAGGSSLAIGVNNSAPNKAYSIRGNSNSNAIGGGGRTNTNHGYVGSTKSASRKQPVPSYSLGASSSASALQGGNMSGSGPGNSRIEPGRIRAPNKLNI